MLTFEFVRTGEDDSEPKKTALQESRFHDQDADVPIVL